MTNKNCVIYTRVSTDNQAEKEFSSCEAQEQKIKSFIASQNDWQVFKVYNDAGFSGATLQRPALQELLSDLKKEKIDIVFVYFLSKGKNFFRNYRLVCAVINFLVMLNLSGINNIPQNMTDIRF